jgi:UDP-GlcNAc3NAcA epimerase
MMAGDVMYDATLWFSERAAERSDVLSALGVTPKHFILATIHRAENTDDPAHLRWIVEAIARVSQKLPVVIPLHPRTQAALDSTGLGALLGGRVIVVPPLSYFDMLLLERNAALIVTDSGGVQKEAFFVRVPCVTLRTETEWTETVTAGWNRLAPPLVTDAAAAMLEELERASRPDPSDSLYGGGGASERIASSLIEAFS